MPKAPIDYKKTIIYKIVCNDLNIKDYFVGHTTNMTKRKSAHKSACNNEKDKKHNLKIYQIIRENGGWSNWNTLVVEEFPCKDKYEACKREREVFEELYAKTQPKPQPQPEPKPQLKLQPKPQPKPQPKMTERTQPQPQPKKDDVIKDIVDEWDMPTITYLLDQTEIGNMTNTIKKLVKKKKIIFPPDLFYSSDGKILLEELIKHYSICEIDEVIIDYIGYIADDAKFPPYKDYYPLYQKRLKKSTLTKILKSTSPLCKRQAKEIEFKKIFV